MTFARPMAEAIGWRDHPFLANCTETAPLLTACMFVAVVAHRLLSRALIIVSAIVITCAVTGTSAIHGHLVFPDVGLFERDASEMMLILIPATLLVIFVVSFVNVPQLAPRHERARRNHRLSITGLLVATAVVLGVIAWKSHVDLMPAASLSQATQIRMQNVWAVVTYAPPLAGIIVCGWWCGFSRARCIVAALLFVVAERVMALSLPNAVGYTRVTTGAALYVAYIAANVAAVRALQRPLVGSVESNP
jgi:hypothetical protein